MPKNFWRRESLLLFFIIFLLTGCASTKKEVKQAPPQPQKPAVPIVIKPGYFSGKVTYNDEPVSQALVYFYQDASSDFSGKAAYVSELTGIDGSFRVKVNPGNYYLVARKGENEEYYTYYGGNPIRITPGQVWPVGLNLMRHKEPDPTSMIQGIPNGTGIRGIVYADDKPLTATQVMVYLNANTNFKGLGFDQRYSDVKGRFILDLPEGTYYLIARKRQSGRMAGPLVTGDSYAYYSQNPLVVKNGKYIDVALSTVKKLDKIEVAIKGRTIIFGMVVDKSDQPLSGLYVGAYLTSQVMGKPDYVSPLTGRDGKFMLELPEGGKYYLVGRNTYAGPPITGDLVGWYEETPDHSIEIKTGENQKNIKIVVSPMF